MTDQAFKDGPSEMGPPELQPQPQQTGRSTLPTRFGDKVVSFTLPRADGERSKGDERSSGGATTTETSGPSASRDWSSAIDLIHEASEAIRISQERSVDLEAQLEQVVAQATNEVQRLNAQIVAGEQKLASTEERLRATEARAAEAEGWLIRLHDAIFSAFTANQQRTTSSQDDAPAETTTETSSD